MTPNMEAVRRRLSSLEEIDPPTPVRQAPAPVRPVSSAPAIRARCSDECLHHWPSVIRQAGSKWEKKFAEEMQARASNRFWRPSAKQLEIMRRMVAQVLGELTDDIQVIEGDHQ